jgi:hypothetical protein
MSKVCNHCGQLKPKSCFSKRSCYKDGLEYYCKICSNLLLREYRRENHGAFLENSRSYRNANRDKINEYNRDYYQKHEAKQKAKSRRTYFKNKDYYILKAKERRAKNKLEIKARSEASRKICLDNKICSICGISKAQDRHHPDYNKPLEIIPVCKRCHLRMHSKQRELKYVEAGV